MAFETTSELREDTLFLANEPTDSTSQLFTKALNYMNFVLGALIGGGTIGSTELEPKDWPWIQKYPRGFLRLLAAWNTDQAITVTLTQNSAIVTTTAMAAGLSLLDYRLIAPSSVNQPAFNARVAVHTAGATTLTLDRTWPYTTVASALVFAVPIYYRLPTDFLRFTSHLIPNGDTIDPVVRTSLRVLESRFPLKDITKDTPVFFALTGYSPEHQQQYVRFSHYVTDPLDLEFEYIFEPSKLAVLTGAATLTFADADPDTITRSTGSWLSEGFAAGDQIRVSGSTSNDGDYTIASLTATVLTLVATDTLAAEGPVSSVVVSTIPAIPRVHRRILSYGAATLLLLDKEDTAAKSRLSEFESIYNAMVREAERNEAAAAESAGRLIDDWVDYQDRIKRDATGRIIPI